MSGVPERAKLLTLGESLSSYVKVERGLLGISLPVMFQNKQYDLNCVELGVGSIQGLEFLFSESPSTYEILALRASEVQVSKVKASDLYKKNAEELFALLESYLPILQKVVRVQQVIETAYLSTHRVFYSFIAVMGYISSKYRFDIRDSELAALVEDVNPYIQKYRLDNKLFPLSNDLYKIPFEEFNDYNQGLDVVGGLYLRRFLQIFDYLKKGLGKDKIVNLNLIMDTAFKVRSALDFCGKKTQAMLGRLQVFLSEDTVSVLREFFQNVSRSQEVSRYLFSVVRSAESFFEQKAILPLKALNQELFLVLKDEFDKHKDMVMRAEQNILSKGGGQEERKVPIPAELRNTLDRILDFAEIQGEDRTKILEEYSRWKISPNRMAVDDVLQKMRRYVAESFWKVYAACFRQHKLHGKPLIKPVELFFKYGLWDETLVGGNILEALLERSKLPSDNDQPNVYSAYDWLVAVCDQKVTVSNSKSGEYPDIVFREIAKEMEQKERRKVDPQEANTLAFRIDYEIDNFVRESAKICNGVFNNYIPLLLEEQFPSIDLSQQIISSGKVRRTFFDLQKLDFSAFYREVRYRNDELGINEFIQKEVLPIFILMPGVGIRSLVWQPKERLKETAARIALPAISFTKPEQIMINSFGFFRWEIVKDILGPSWNDISLLSLTSEYSDYESTYKNSKALDDETKERIALDFKKYRTTRDRFIHDYSRWMTIDSQGRPGVNKVVRELFYRQVPFPKDVRARLASMPAYEQLNDRYLILMKREIAKIRLKYQKYQREDGSLPPELEGFLQFLAR